MDVGGGLILASYSIDMVNADNRTPCRPNGMVTMPPWLDFKQLNTITRCLVPWLRHAEGKVGWDGPEA